MKRITKLFSLAVLALSLTAFSQAQTTTITASHLELGAFPISTGIVTFTPVSTNGLAIAFSDGSGAQHGPTAFACQVTAGAITGAITETGTTSGTCQVPDSTETTPANILYTAQVCDQSLGLRTSGQCYTLQNIVGISGTTWALDHYGPPAQTSNVATLQATQGTTVPTSCTAPSVFTQLNSGGSFLGFYTCVGGSEVAINAGGVGATGATGATGPAGSAATVTIGSTTTLAAGSSATVTNSGTSAAAILNFGIPQGAAGSGGGASSFSALTGTATPSQLPAATSSAQGAVQLPTGQSSNVLGSAAFTPSTAYDIFGAAAARGTAPLNSVPVEQFGAVADYPGPGGGTGVGTDNTTPIQNCINYVQTTLGSGQCLLKQGNYRITSALSITHSSVGIRGSSYGPGVVTQNGQLAANAPTSAIYIDSATADGIDVNPSGTLTTPINNNQFDDFTIMRTKAPTTSGSGCGTGVGPAGLSIQFAGGFTVDHVVSEDSACNFYFNGGGAIGIGSVENSMSLWGFNGFNPAITVYGFNVNGASNPDSLRIRHTHSTTNNISGITSYGYYIAGPHIADVFLDNAESAFQTYGRYWNCTGTAFAQCADLHDVNGVSDSSYVSCVYVTGLTAVTIGSLEVNGGYCDSNTASSKLIDIENSTGVSVSNLQLLPNGAGAVAVRAANSSHLAIKENNILPTAASDAAAIQLATVSDSVIADNVISTNSGNPTTTFISATSLTNSSITGNSIGGYGTTGISLDSSSNNNRVGAYINGSAILDSAFNAIDPANITTLVTNAGTGNLLPLGSTPTTVTYVNTTFNEASAGTALAGTTPATCASGCTGPWALLNGNDWLYQSGPGIAITVTSANADYINTGQTNETIRWTVTSSSSVNLHLLARLTHTATAYYFQVAMNGATGVVSPVNMASGVGTNACSPISGTVVGSYTLALNGTSFTLTAPSGSCSGSISASATGTEVGFAADAGTSAMSAFSVKNN